MKRVRIGLIAAAVLAVATVAWTQAKPDFSGSWTPDPGGAAVGEGRGRGMGGGPMTVKQTADTLTIERTMGENKVTRTYKLDGSESEITMGQMTAKASAKWDGDKLVITTKTDMGEQTQTWSLADGVLTIERTGGRGGPSKMVYKKGS
jgi:hypothetical protein